MRDEKDLQILDYWENPNTVSLQDENLRHLEVQTILRWLRPDDFVVDIGCGDGVNSIAYGGNVRRLVGIDYSAKMIQRATQRLDGSEINNIEFRHCSVQELQQISEQFDVAITQRCLINLTSFEAQSAAILDIHKLLRPRGLYLMLECVEQGRERLNHLRAAVGFAPLPMPWHNRFFDLGELLPLLRAHFDIIAISDFSTYFLLTRLFNGVLGVTDHLSPLSKQIDAAAQQLQLQLNLDQLSGIGAQRLFVLRKHDLTS